MLRSLLLLSIVAPFAIADDWPGLFGPTRDGQSKETKLNWTWPKAGPPIDWKADVGKGNAGPVVAKGVVYLWQRLEDDDVLSTYAADTGKPGWVYKTAARGREGPQSAPLIAGDAIYALGYGGKLSAVNLKDGTKKWTVDFQKDYKSPEGYFGYGQGLIAIGKNLIANVGAKGAGIVAFDLETGKEAWKATDDPASYSTPASIDWNGKPHAVVFTRTGLVVIDAATGEVSHSRKHRASYDASVNASTPLVKGNEVFLTSSYQTGALLAKLGKTDVEEVWMDDATLSCHFNTPIRIGDYLFGVHGRQEGNRASLVCAKWSTGGVQWREKEFGAAHLICVDDGLLALRENGEIVRFEATELGYKPKANSILLDGLTRAPPALADGRLFLRNETTLIAANLKGK